MGRPSLAEIGGITILDADWVTGPLAPKSLSIGESNPQHALGVALETEADGILASIGVTPDPGENVKASSLQLKLTNGSDLQREYLRIAGETGLVVPIFNLDIMDHGVTPTSSNPDLQDLALARMSEAVDAVSEMRGIGSPDGSVDPSIRLAFFGDNRLTDEVIGKKTRATSIIREMAQEAGRRGVRVEIETDRTAVEDVAFIHRLGAGNVGAVADTGNIHKTSQDMGGSIRFLVQEGLLPTLDIKDNSTQSQKPVVRPMQLGSSSSRFDLVPVVRDLVDGGWKGNVVVEQISHRRYQSMPPRSTEGQRIVTADLLQANRYVRGVFAAQQSMRSRVG